MSGQIQLRAFMGLAQVFRERHWTNPRTFELAGEITGREMMKQLGIAEQEVEIIFVNRKAYKPDAVTIKPGDRVALVPPGVPGPYRALLGFKKTDVSDDS
jgi:molybdopterin converting factor small subunit